MFPRCSLLLFICLHFGSLVFGQNASLNPHVVSGTYRGMAGAGLAVVDDISSMDLNPGGLSVKPARGLSVGLNAVYIAYNLFNNYNDQWAKVMKWNDQHYNVEHVLAGVPLTQHITLGIGVIQKLNPVVNNNRRYITYSVYFHHETDGSVYALCLSSGIRVTKNLSLGITLYRYTGTIASTITGDDHGRLSDAWARCESHLKGTNVRIGIQWRRDSFGAGFIVEKPFSMTVEANTSVSDDALFLPSLPPYDQTSWNMPLVLGFGLAYTGIKKWTFCLDAEFHPYEESDIQINLFEYGGQPNWKHTHIFRAGVEGRPFKKTKIPIRAGYAYIPQLYASNRSVGDVRGVPRVDAYQNAEQNVMHLFTVGSTFGVSPLSFHLAFEYGILHWHRVFTNHATMNDDYTERVMTLSVDMVYSL